MYARNSSASTRRPRPPTRSAANRPDAIRRYTVALLTRSSEATSVGASSRCLSTVAAITRTYQTYTDVLPAHTAVFVARGVSVWSQAACRERMRPGCPVASSRVSTGGFALVGVSGQVLTGLFTLGGVIVGR